MHDPLDRLVGRLQHLVIIRIDRQVGVHIAVAGVHVQGNEDAAAQHFLVDGFNAFDNRAIDATVEDLGQADMQLLLPRCAHRVILQAVEQGGVFRPVGQFTGNYAVGCEARFGFGQRQVEVFEQPFPAQADSLDVIKRGLPAVADQHVGVDGRVAAMQWQVALEEFAQRIA